MINKTKIMGKTYIIADIHGEIDKLINCLNLVNFDYEEDTLIQLGDVVDRGFDSYLVVEELLKIKNLIAIKGNHDHCFYRSIVSNTENLLYNGGGRETLESYVRHVTPDKFIRDFTYEDMPLTHISFFKNQLPCYIDTENNLFIHGGFNRHYYIDDPTHNDESVFIWDRDLFTSALSYASMRNNEFKFKMKNNFKEVFIGHTPTTYYDSTTPINAANIWNLDTGCGKGGLLTLMNLETKEFVQS